MTTFYIFRERALCKLCLDVCKRLHVNVHEDVERKRSPRLAGVLSGTVVQIMTARNSISNNDTQVCACSEMGTGSSNLPIGDSFNFRYTCKIDPFWMCTWHFTAIHRHNYYIPHTYRLPYTHIKMTMWSTRFLPHCQFARNKTYFTPQTFVGHSNYILMILHIGTISYQRQ